MKEITENIGTLYHPKAALLIYGADNHTSGSYVEYFDIDKKGCPINAHPLTVREAQSLAKALNTEKESNNAFLKPKGIIGNHILHLDTARNGSVIWFTKSSNKDLFFRENLGIPNGQVAVPALLWVANKQKLNIYALKSDRRPTETTPLYHAPFFNVYADGNVCMGTVDISIKKSASLEEFTNAWEDYFFNSYFSHLMSGHNPIKGNCVNLWKKLRKSGMAFPKDVLVKDNRALKNLIR